MSHKKRRGSSTWRTFGTIDPRFARLSFLGMGIAMAFATLYLFTGLEIFHRLMYVSGAILMILALVPMMARSCMKIKRMDNPHTEQFKVDSTIRFVIDEF